MKNNSYKMRKQKIILRIANDVIKYACIYINVYTTTVYRYIELINKHLNNDVVKCGFRY